MAYKRMAVRCHHANDLSGSEQQAYADEVQSRLDGTDINGYMICHGGDNWIEWEGEKSTVEQKVAEHLNDSRVAGHDVIENTEIGSLNLDKWRAHTEPDLHCELQ